MSWSVWAERPRSPGLAWYYSSNVAQTEISISFYLITTSSVPLISLWFSLSPDSPSDFLPAPPAHQRSICLADSNSDFRNSSFLTKCWSRMFNVSSNKNFTSPLRKKVETCPQIHLCASSSVIASERQSLPSPAVLFQKVFHHSVAKCEGEERVHSKTPSWYQPGRWSGQEDLQHVVYLGLKETGGVPGGCAGDQYYTRVELDLELSARLPWQRPTWNPLNIYFLSTELTDKWMKWEGKEQLSSLFLISAHFSSCLSPPSSLLAVAHGAPTLSICFAF